MNKAIHFRFQWNDPMLLDSQLTAHERQVADAARAYAPNDWQVDQTGKIVAPQLYVAV